METMTDSLLIRSSDSPRQALVIHPMTKMSSLAVKSRTVWIAVLGLIIAFQPETSNAQSPSGSPRHSLLVDVAQQASPAVLPLFVEGDQRGRFGSGSAAIIHRDGYALTNNHVVSKNKGLAIYRDKLIRFVVAGRLPEKDLAVIRLKGLAAPCPVIPLGQSHDVMMGESIAVMGNPGGRGIVLTSGVISSPKTFIDVNALIMTQYPGSRRDTFIQFDAASNRGNSGGPLLNMDGELIGVVAALRPDEQNSSFAIPIQRVRESFGRILQPEIVHQREVGIRLSPGADIAIIASLVPESPAAAAGIQVGDVIAKVNGEPLRHAVDWQIQLDQKLPSSNPLKLIVKRGSTELPISIQPRSSDAYESVSVESPEPGLVYDFYDGHHELIPDFSKMEADRSGVAADLDLAEISGDSKQDHAIRLTGYIEIEQAGLYRLALTSDDGSRLTLHGKTLIDNDGDHPPMVASGLVRLDAGHHPIEIGFFQGRSGQTLSMTAQRLENAADDVSDQASSPSFFHVVK